MPSKDTKSRGVADLIRSSGFRAQSVIENSVGCGDIVEEALDGRNVRIFNVLQYAEASWGLDMGLYPVQRFIVKLYYNMPLDNKVRDIIVTDMFKSRVLYEFTEVEYLKFLYSEGRCNIGEQDHMRRQLILPIGRRSGKCNAVSNTFVCTSKGVLTYASLGDLSGPQWQPLVDLEVVQSQSKRAKVAYFYNNGVAETRKVRTRSGYLIEGTPNHRILVMTPEGTLDWKELDSVAPGDIFAINRGSDLWSSEYVVTPLEQVWGKLPSTLNEDFGLLLGVLTGDGSWTQSEYVEVTGLKSQVDWVSSVSSLVLGHPGRIFAAKGSLRGYRWRFDVTSTGVPRAGSSVRRVLDLLGWTIATSPTTKCVPWSIMQSPRSVVCAFLRGLFETDGGMEGGNVTFSTASPRLAHEVQVLLTNLGIIAVFSKKLDNGYKRYYYRISIRGQSSRASFSNLIGFGSTHKKKLLQQSIALSSTRLKSDSESIPNQQVWVQQLLSLVPKLQPLNRGSVPGARGWGRSNLRKSLGNCTKRGSKDQLTYPGLRKSLIELVRLCGTEVLKHPVVQHFQELIQENFFYDPVASVVISSDHVCDLNVPDGAYFTANGLVNHNTTLSAIFASYELYRLIQLGNPQKYYGLPNGNRIQVISVATDKDQAGLLFNDVTAHLTKCEFFKPYIANNTLSYVQFRTPYDIEKYGPTVRHENGKFTSFNGKASIRVTFKASVSKGLRGSGNIVIILDEMAHFQDKGISSAKDIYDAVTPSALAFSPKDPRNKSRPIGPVESRIISISSPLNRGGKFYELFHFAMSRAEGSENMLAIQAPTWEVNPTVEPEFLRQKYHEDPTVFMTEYGAEFSDRVRAWIEREQDLIECIQPDRRPRNSGPSRYPHQMGIDVGVTAGKDGTAIAITHLEGSTIVHDYHEVWYAGTPWRESNPHLQSPLLSYARTIDEVERLDFDEISNWISELCKKFYITDGLFDRWNGLPLEQSLHKKGLKQFKSEFFTRDQKSRMFQAAKLTMLDHRLQLYDYPLPDSAGSGGKHSAFINELLTLEGTQFAKNQVTVEAPKIAGAHDDVSDALVRAIWLSLEKLANTKVVAHGYSGSQPKVASSLQHYQVSRMRSHGIVRDRMTPRMMGRRY